MSELARADSPNNADDLERYLPIERVAVIAARAKRRAERPTGGYRPDFWEKAYADNPMLLELGKVREIESRREDNPSASFKDLFFRTTSGERMADWIQRATALSVPYLTEEQQDFAHGRFRLPELETRDGKVQVELFYTDEPDIPISFLLPEDESDGDDPEQSTAPPWQIGMRVTHLASRVWHDLVLRREWFMDPALEGVRSKLIKIGLRTAYSLHDEERTVRDVVGMLVLHPHGEDGRLVSTMLEYLDKSRELAKNLAL